MNQMFPVIELIDRYAIAMIKFRHTNGANQDELAYYQEQISALDIEAIEHDLRELEIIHETIWSLESELKSGKEHLLPLEEIGRRAISIRDWNNKRVGIKNRIAETLAKDLVREIKKDHLSA